MQAEVVTLRSGKVMQGTLVMQNDEVLILRDESGARFQFPAAEVVSVAEEEVVEEQENLPQVKDTKKTSQSRIALRLMTNSSVVIVPGHYTSGGIGVDLWIGSRRIGERRVFLGGGVGFNTAWLPDRINMYIPLQVVMSMPLTEGKHAPEIGLGFGYGFSAHQTRGGLVAHLALSWRYQFSEKSAMLFGVRASFQADDYPVTETEDGIAYSGMLGRSLVNVGLNLGLEF